METAFVLAVVTGVIGFATMMIGKYSEQVKWYQEKLLPAVENNTISLAEIKRLVESKVKDTENV